METIDILIFISYFVVMMGVGFFFLRKNKTADDYYLGGRNMSSLHVGLSVVATDVGGGFSIGLGGLGFVMGLSGSWMLFTGLIGAWLAAVLLIPRISKISKKVNLFTFPQIFEFFYNKEVALLAGIISAIGYLGFTSSQLLAGAKLADGTFNMENFGQQHWLLVMGIIAVVYTSVGGLKAVIYTDTIQWIILLSGLLFIGLPLGYDAVGGFEGVRSTLGDEYLSFTNLRWQDMVNWFVTIVPIWFVGMTLYQRIYACRDEKQAKRAWYIAGLFEWPIMAIMGVMLGLFSRVAYENGMFAELGHAAGEGMDKESGIPMLLRTTLPMGYGLLGLMMSAYFSAIMSTADSCLMAASGNLQTDILRQDLSKGNIKAILKKSQYITFGIGAVAVAIAFWMTEVLDLMLYSYAFMVSGLFVPVVAALFTKNPSSTAAFWCMIIGGSTTIILQLLKEYTDMSLPLELDPNIFGITASVLTFIFISKNVNNNTTEDEIIDSSI